MDKNLNRVFRVIWNEALGAWVAVAEFVRARGKRSKSSRAASGAALAILGALSAPALAGPTGGQIISGTASITNPVAGTTQITQSTNRAIINWATFNVGSTERVNFNVPTATAATLNRVIGTGRSDILGNISSNGKVFLVNPNGIYFGAGSTVNVGSLVASTLNISDADFNAGRYKFARGTTTNGITNLGNITAASGGSIALIAPTVVQQGTLNAPRGTVAIAAGDAVTFTEGCPAGDVCTGANVEPVVVDTAAQGASIESHGTINAAGGSVIMRARTSDNVLRNVINHTGVIEAGGLATRGGRVYLDGGSKGTVRIAGQVLASSTGSTGGKIQTAGQVVNLDTGTRIKADGQQGGGSIQKNAEVLLTSSDASLTANATQTGNGGDIVLTSTKHTRFLGSASASSAGANGGNVTVGSDGVTDFGGSATTGAGGTVTLSAKAVEIKAAARTNDTRTAEQLLATTGDDVSSLSVASIEAMGPGKVSVQGDGYVYVRDLTENGGKGSIDLQRNTSLELYGKALENAPTIPANWVTDLKPGGVYFKNANNTINASGNGGVTLVAGAPSGAGFNPIAGVYNAPNINTQGADITLKGADIIVSKGVLNSNGGKITLDADSDRLGAGLLLMMGAARSNNGNIEVNVGAEEGSGAEFRADANAGSGRLLLSVSPTLTPNDPSSYFNYYRIGTNANLTAAGDINFGQQTIIGNNSSITTTGAVKFAGPVGFETNAAHTITAGTAGVQFSQPVSGNGGSLTLRPYDKTSNIRLGATGTGMDLSTVLPKASGFSQITVGRSDGTGKTLVSGTNALDGKLTLVQGGTGGNVEFAADARITDNGNQSSSVLIQTADKVSTGANTRIEVAQGITIEAAGDVTLGSGNLLKTTQAGSKVVIAANKLTNPGGNNTISAPRWLVYLPDPTQAADANLTSNFKRYGCDYKLGCETATVPTNGNGFLYRITPTLTVTSNSTGNTYGDADPSGFATRYSGFIDGDTAATAGITGQATHTLGSYTPSAAGYRPAGSYAINHSVAGMASELGYRIVAGTANTHTVSPRLLSNATLNTQSKEYDGTTAATATLSALGALPGDRIGGAISNANFADKNAGTDKLVTANVTLSGPEAANYRIEGNTVSGLGTITPKVLDASGLTVSFNDRVYNGNTTATGQVASRPTGIIGTDDVTATVENANFSDKNVGQNKTVTATLGLRGTASGNYVFRSATRTGTASITPKIVDATLAATFDDREYDGTTLANGRISNPAVMGLIDGDSVTAQISRANFIDKNAGTNKTVNATVALSGDSSGNYILRSNTTTGTATIRPKVIDAALAANFNDKVYDGNTAATGSLANPTLSGLIDGDTVTARITQANFSDKNAATGKTVNATVGLAGASSGNYVLRTTTTTGTASITPKVIDATLAANFNDKVYDGNTRATGSLTNPTLSGLISGDTVNARITDANFSDKNAAQNKNVTATVGLEGASSGNYVLRTNTTTGTASITPKVIDAPISAAFNDKVYDGTTTATGNVTNPTLAGIIDGDSVSARVRQANFSDKNVGNSKTVNATLELTGTSSGNYILRTTTTTGTASITPKVIDAPISAAFNDKVYDGNTTATGTITNPRPIGLIDGDSVSARIKTANFVDKNAGQGKAVNAELELAGTSSGNYILRTTTTVGTASITPKALGSSVAARFDDKVYDGNTTATGALTSTSLTGVIAGDTVGIELRSANFADKNAGQGKPVEAQLGLTGDAAGNYTLAAPTTTGTAAITPKIIDAPAVTFLDRRYDGTTIAKSSVAPFAPGAVIDGDNLAATVTNANFADPRSGVNKPVTGQLNLAGDDAGNYRLTNNLSSMPVSGTATILPDSYALALEGVYATSTAGATILPELGDAFSRLIAGGVKLPAGLEPTPMFRVER